VTAAESRWRKACGLLRTAGVVSTGSLPARTLSFASAGTAGVLVADVTSSASRFGIDPTSVTCARVEPFERPAIAGPQAPRTATIANAAETSTKEPLGVAVIEPSTIFQQATASAWREKSHDDRLTAVPGGTGPIAANAGRYTMGRPNSDLDLLPGSGERGRTADGDPTRSPGM